MSHMNHNIADLARVSVHCVRAGLGRAVLLFHSFGSSWFAWQLNVKDEVLSYRPESTLPWRFRQTSFYGIRYQK